jgi:hypothetical protein
LLERGIPRITTFATIRRLCFAKMSSVTHLVLFVSLPAVPLLVSDTAISQLDTDDTLSAVGDIRAIPKECRVRAAGATSAGADKLAVRHRAVRDEKQELINVDDIRSEGGICYIARHCKAQS